MQTSSKSIEYIDYVVVFHGIGEQRANETVMDVINRMAEIRHSQDKPSKKHVISLGMVTSQTGSHQLDKELGATIFRGVPWAEFEGIPREKPDSALELDPFLGIPSRSGENLRFVDGHWADIMQTHYADVAQSLGHWASSLIGRLEILQERHMLPHGERWVLPVLYRLEESLTLLEFIVSLKLPGLGTEIFEKYMGDIQLYGEYSVVRGQATKRFHQLFEHLERQHRRQLRLDDDYVQVSTGKTLRPRYTIIAHSLGTIMSLDALMYAHFNKRKVIRSTKHLANLPFMGYDMEDVVVNDERFGETWIDDVESFVTLGSPIDKFLTIWWNNYRYMEERALYVEHENFLDPRPNKIRHFNFCDEQDPVGHSLDLLNTKEGYHRVFELNEDSVYNRYAVPGAAHTKYWGDIELFQHIMDNTVDALPHREVVKQEEAPPPNQPAATAPLSSKEALRARYNFDKSGEEKPQNKPKTGKKPSRYLGLRSDFVTFKPKIYRQVLIYSYFLLPSLCILTMFPAFVFAFRAESITTLAISAFVFVVSQFIFFRFIKLMVWWRQILKAKSQDRVDAVEGQKAGQKMFWISFYSLMLFHYVGSILVIPGFMMEEGAEAGTNFLITSAIALALGVLLYFRFRSKRQTDVNKDYSMRWTFIFVFFLITSIFAFFVFEIFPLGDPVISPPDEPKEEHQRSLYYGLGLASYFFFSSIIWVYTYICFTVARRVLHYN